MKTMIITGGSRGIGAELVRRFAGDGWAVTFCCRSALSEEERAALPANVRACRCDVSDEGQVRHMMADFFTAWHHLDALVVNAGQAWSGLTEYMPAAEFDRVAGVNLRGAFLCTREALPFLRASRGSIVFVSSMWGRAAASCESVYAATKAGLCAFAASLAREVGPSGVRVNCVAPGPVDTDMMRGYSAQDKQALAEQAPLGRLCTVEDVADACAFLLSPRAGFITGQTLLVDGGLTL